MLAWPLLIWAGLHYGVMAWLLPVMLLLLILRLGLTWRLGLLRTSAPMVWVAPGVMLVALLLCLASLVLKQHRLLLYYPLVVNLLLFGLFAGSLLTRMSLIERIARWRDASLPASAVRYTRRVTQLWCVFFIVNGAISLVTCLSGDITLWATWNGLLSYICMGCLMAGEWLVRRWVIKHITS